MESIAQDLVQVFRSMRRAPMFTAAALMALVLGIGVNTAVFSVVHGVLFRPLPYSDPHELVRLWENNAEQGIDRGPVSSGAFAEVRSQSRTLDRVGLFFARDWLFTIGDDVAEARGASVSPALFDVLGVQPHLGRTFQAEDETHGQTGLQEAVIGYRMWRRTFGGDPSVIGRTIRFDDHDMYTIVGVMPAGFDFPDDSEIWRPEITPATIHPLQREFRYYGAVGRLSTGSTLDQAHTEVAAIAARLADEHPASNTGWMLSIERLDDSMVGHTRLPLIVLLGLVGCVLLIACGNVANLIVARTTARRREIAVRRALGASPERLLRQSLLETTTLCVLGGLGGVLLASWLIRGIVRFAPTGIPRLDEISLSASVLLFAFGVTGATALITGLTPAFQMLSGAPFARMGSGSRSTDRRETRAREWLVGSQVALTLVLVVTATLLLRSFVALQRVDLGFQSPGVLTADLQVPSWRFADPRPWFQLSNHFSELIEEIGSLPGVSSVAGVTAIPLTGEDLNNAVWRADAPGADGRTPPMSLADQWNASMVITTPGYFSALGVPVLRGRDFDESDRFPAEIFSAPGGRPIGVAIIDEAMADRYWPGEDPIGYSIVVRDDQLFTGAYRTIVGVVGNVRGDAIRNAPSPTVYLPFSTFPGSRLSLVIRSETGLEVMAEPITNQIRSFDPLMSVSSLRPLDSIVAEATSRERFVLFLSGGFAALALCLAALGIFGIMGFVVSRRVREIGVRLALGSSTSGVVWLVLRNGLRSIILGAIVGCLAALALGSVVRSILFGLAPVDWTSFVIAVLILFIVASIAALVPALRAARIPPGGALRYE